MDTGGRDQKKMKTIRARIEASAIARVSRFFDAGDRQVVDEVFQNARRAGATAVDVRVDERQVAVSDDGRGIGDPQTLLAFGGSAWTEETARAEDPAGMGFFSLARRRAAVESRTAAERDRGWRVALEPEHFVGEAEAEVHSAPRAPTPHGTRVTFARRRADDDLELTVRKAARYYPLPVTLNGRPVEQQGWLDNTIHVEEYMGVRIGVRTQWVPDPRGWWVNFHGQTIDCPELPVVTPVSERGGMSPRQWWAMVDIDDCPGLELVLPRRDRLVDTPFLDQLKAACLRAILRAIAAQGDDTRLGSATMQQARAEGIEIPEPPPELHQWRPAEARGSYGKSRYEGCRTKAIEATERTAPVLRETESGVETCGAHPALVMAAPASAATQQVVARALSRAGLRNRVFEGVDRYTGYEWYDQLQRITAVEVSTEMNGVSEQLVLDDEVEHRQRTRSVERIRVTLRIGGGGKEPRTLTLDTDVAFDADPESSGPQGVSIVTVEGADTTSTELTDLLMRSFFDVSEDTEADSEQTQAEWEEREYRRMATAALLSPAEARREELREVTASYVGVMLKAGETVVAARGSDGKLKIEVTAAEGAAVS